MAKVVRLRGAQRPSPAAVLRKVLRRPKNAEVRSREYLLEKEVEALRAAAKGVGRHGHRDSTLILITYRHGLRVSEVIALQWDQVDFDSGTLHVNRLKNGKPATHPLDGTELRALRKLRRDYPVGPFLFVTERGGPMIPSTFNKLLTRAGKRAEGIDFPVHPHMLRHGTGYYLANIGVDTRTIQDYLGHRNITHTVRYTELSPARFKGLWRKS